MGDETGHAGYAPPEWRVSGDPVPYPHAVAMMQARAADIAAGRSTELIWLLEHPHCYTAGTSAADHDLIDPGRWPIHRAQRGGRWTYHGPGQRIVYVMLDVRRWSGDIRAFVLALEGWIIDALQDFGVHGVVRRERVGVWVPAATGDPGADRKIAALGLRVQRGISLHGFSLNVSPDLAQFDGIVPCGERGLGVTSLADLGVETSLDEVDAVLQLRFATAFSQSSATLGSAWLPNRK